MIRPVATFHIIHAHHGTLRAESTLGVGTTMTVLRPAATRGAHLA